MTEGRCLLAESYCGYTRNLVDQAATGRFADYDIRPRSVRTLLDAVLGDRVRVHLSGHLYCGCAIAG